MKRIVMLNVPVSENHEGNHEEQHYEEKTETPKERYDKVASNVLPKDWEFMEQSGEVLKNLPATWRAYPDTEEGRMGIVKMEYGELMKAQTDKEKMHELMHLASACLHLWRLYNATDAN